MPAILPSAPTDDVGAEPLADDETQALTAGDDGDVGLEAADAHGWSEFDREPGVDYGERAHLGPDGQPLVIERHLVVPPERAGLRLDHFIKQLIPRLSRTKIQAVIETDVRASHGRRLRPSTTVAAGDVYTVRREARPEPPCPRRLDELYVDDDLVVISKPAGLPVHASAKFYFNTLTRVLAERYADPHLQICHRLDRETSGALVVARHRQAARVVKQAFEYKRVKKTYRAIVHGVPPWDQLRIDATLRVATARDQTPLVGVRMIAGADGLPSCTDVVIEARGADIALVRCTPITGRQHQIRAHLAHVGYPIVGDKLYAHGDQAFMRFCDHGLDADLRARFQLPRHALHAASIGFTHPRTATWLDIEAPLPADLAGFLRARAINLA